MKVVPVLDLSSGRVVRAAGGRREAYRPIRSSLCDGSAPVDIAKALNTYCNAAILYIADLDALGGGTPQYAVLAAIGRALPGVEIWLDAGLSDAADADALLARLPGLRLRLVFGSETLQCVARASPFDAHPDAVLSLDRRNGTPLGATSWWESPTEWPDRVIVMTLDRVGADSGPDLGLFTRIRRMAGPFRTLVGAGGIRSEADLDAVTCAGADAWLVASAIHDRRIPPCSPDARGPSASITFRATQEIPPQRRF